jgi:ribosomal protein L29
MKIQEIRDKSVAERTILLVDLQDKARKLRFDLSLREAKNHREYRKMKKDIARILTIAREEEVVLDESQNKA